MGVQSPGMSTPRALTRKLVHELLGKSGVADYLHNTLHAVAPYPRARVTRALSNADVVTELVRLMNLPEQGAKGVEAFVERWRKQWRAPVRPIAPRRDAVATNLLTLAGLFGLEPLERDIVRLALEVKQEPLLEDLLRQLGSLGLTRRGGAVAALLGVPRDVAAKALGPKSRLNRLGLLASEQSDDALELAPHLTALFDEARALDADAMRGLLLPGGRAPTLALDDFGHVPDAALAAEVVARSLRAGVRGINVLLYGEPGTGKTEFARVLAATAGATLAELEQADGTRDVAGARLARLRSTLQLAPARSAVVLFDELEDLFERVGFLFFASMKAQMSKQAFNELLETNPVPVVWTANHVEGVDPAFLRRFTCAVAFRPLGTNQRARVLARQLPAGALPPAEVQAIARRYAASPAQLHAAVQTSRLLGDGVVTRATLERVLAPSEQLVTGEDPRLRPVFDPSGFREDVLNASIPVAELVSAVKRWEPGRGALAMCFSGPPGTGKTELAHYLASVLDKPVLRKTAADLLDKYVGGTEQRLAEAFRSAQQDGAVLLFDEVDSLLRDRRRANQSWEVTQVNELLQQLEVYRGVVVCTTNLVEDLDQAALRRFPFKVQFSWLHPGQAAALFFATLGDLVPGATEEEVRLALRGLHALAPGDFAALSKRARWLDRRWSVPTLVTELAQEAASRRTTPRVGFLC